MRFNAVSMDAVAICTGGGVVDTITMDELTPLLVADSWNDVRPDWPEEEIMKYYPGTDSGRFDFMVEILFAGDPGPCSGREDDYVLVQVFKAIPGPWDSSVTLTLWRDGTP